MPDPVIAWHPAAAAALTAAATSQHAVLLAFWAPG